MYYLRNEYIEQNRVSVWESEICKAGTHLYTWIERGTEIAVSCPRIVLIVPQSQANVPSGHHTSKVKLFFFSEMDVELLQR